MISVDNRNILRIKNRGLLNTLTDMEYNEPTGNVIVEPAKSGIPTLKIVLDGSVQYVHSKYDPLKDAERLISQFQVGDGKHVLFIGAGLGYHIQAFAEAHPDTKFSIYEPNEEVLLAYLSHATINDNLSHIFTDSDSENTSDKVQELSRVSKGMLKIISLPIYEKIYGDKISIFTKKIINELKRKSSSQKVDIAFQKRWVVNSIKNLPIVLKTPNILHDIDKKMFEGKPAIIVAAGPSLNEEFENLRYIKNNGLAYIFSVGSAINSLIEHGIYPDATCTYDPQGRNYKAIQIIKDKHLSNIPLIFGSSVGFETLEDYPGKMIHMIVSQDTLAPVLLKHNQSESLDFVYDAPSIAVITFQLLCKLGFNQIILVGQNLGYLTGKQYARGIAPSYSREIQEQSFTNAMIVKDVHGNDVKTTEGYNNMRQQFEMHIARSKHVNIINTTKGGVAIEGTVYKPLSELIEQQLTMKVVSQEWLEGKNDYNSDYLVSQLINLTAHQKSLQKLLQSALNNLEILQQKVSRRTLSNIENDYSNLDKTFESIIHNLFYNHFTAPMFRVQIDQFEDSLLSAHYEKNKYKKAEMIVHAFQQILTECSRHYDLSLELFEEMRDEIKSKYQI